MPCPVRTSTCRSLDTISSGFGRFVPIFDPPFPNYYGGPLQWGRIKGSVIHTRFDLDEPGSGNVDLVVVPARIQRRKSRKNAASKEVLTISTRMAKEELRKAMKAKTSGQAMQSSWSQWCKDRLDPRIERGLNKGQTRREHIHADVLRAEGDKLRAEHEAAMNALEFEKQTAAERAKSEAKAAGDALFLWAKAATGPYQGIILDDLSDAEQQAYDLHRMVVDRYRAALSAERDGRLYPEQSRFLSELRNAEPDPDRNVAAALAEEIGGAGIDLDMIERISELMRRLLQRIVQAVEAHLLRNWTREDGWYSWDVTTAGLCLGSSELVNLEARVEREATDLRAAEPVYRRLAKHGHVLDH